MKTCFILNPRSGHSARARGPVEAFAASRRAEVRLTTGPRHARELAAQAVAEGFGLVVAVGGDGTLNEVASSVAETSAVLGLVSCGSGNGLGRHLGLHGSVARSLSILETGRPRTIDTGMAGGRRFVNVAGLGFEADLAERFNRLRRRGLPRYAVATFREWLLRHPYEFTVTCDGAREHVRAATIAVANGSQYGNNFRIASAASVDDGKLDVVALPFLGVLGGTAMLWKVLRGRAGEHPGVRHWRTTGLTIEPAVPGLLHLDGETRRIEGPVEFVVRPGSLRIMTPA